jgi:hypothetical protein
MRAGRRRRVQPQLAIGEIDQAPPDIVAVK